MTAPEAASSRPTPDGIPLGDGYSTKITIADDTDISFWEKAVTPPGLDGGDEIDLTTMHNTSYRTFGSRALATMTEMSCTALYDPDVYDEILAIINVETTITVFFPDGSTLAFYGFLKRFEPGELVEGTPPECTITIQPTNQDPTSRAEESAVMTEASGT